jgi:uncharacterized SAM-binding protein YcdF (DUF218 family)
MRHSLIAGLLLLAASTCIAQSSQKITEEEARAIALKAAGCRSAEACVVLGGLQKGNWVFVVSFVMGRDAKGEPLFAPGGHVGITVSPEGKVIERMPGA